MGLSREVQDAIACSSNGFAQGVSGALTALCLALRPVAATETLADGGYVDVASLAVALHVSRATINRHKRDAAFPRHVVGGRDRFVVADVKAFLDQRGRRAAPSPETGAPDSIDVDRALRAGGLRIVGGK